MNPLPPVRAAMSRTMAPAAAQAELSSLASGESGLSRTTTKVPSDSTEPMVSAGAAAKAGARPT